MSACDGALRELGAETTSYSGRGIALQILGEPESRKERQEVCGQILECVWDETGDVSHELTVESNNAYNACFEIVISLFD